MQPVKVVALEYLVGELCERHTLSVHPLFDRFPRDHGGQAEMRTYVPQEGDHTHVLIEGVIVDEGQRRKRGGDILDLEFRFQVGVQVGSEVVKLLFELVDVMLDCIREKLLPLGGAPTGVSNQAGGSPEDHNRGVAS